MDTRKLLSTTVLYGLADVIVMAVGGFLLLPLYTRTLSQSEFGTYVVVRTNTEIFSYLLYLGLPSAVARVYFDYKKTGQQQEYLASVVVFFGLNLVLLCALLSVWGPGLWRLLSPTTDVQPYLVFSVAIAAVGFFSSLGTLCLRLVGRARAFASLQVATSLVLAACAVLNLAVLSLGLSGLLWALLISSAFAGLVLPWQLGRSFRPRIRWVHIADSMRYAGPIVVGYFAYFLLNRASTLVLQRHVALDQIAIFGLAQQLAMMVTVAAVAFGKAQQPVVFAAEPGDAAVLLLRAGALLRRLMLGITAVLVLGAPELFALVAPEGYASGTKVLLILLVANFGHSFSQVSDTALLYHRRAKTSVAVSITGAVLSATLSLWLVPTYDLLGAAIAIACAFIAMTVLSHELARRQTGHSYLVPMLGAITTVGLIAGLTAWLAQQSWPAPWIIALKVAVGATVLAATAVTDKPKTHSN